MFLRRYLVGGDKISDTQLLTLTMGFIQSEGRWFPCSKFIASHLAIIAIASSQISFCGMYSLLLLSETHNCSYIDCEVFIFMFVNVVQYVPDPEPSREHSHEGAFVTK